MKKLPCDGCLVLAICKGRIAKERQVMPLAESHCSILRNYLAKTEEEMRREMFKDKYHDGRLQEVRRFFGLRPLPIMRVKL